MRQLHVGVCIFHGFVVLVGCVCVCEKDLRRYGHGHHGDCVLKLTFGYDRVYPIHIDLSEDMIGG